MKRYKKKMAMKKKSFKHGNEEDNGRPNGLNADVKDLTK